MVRMTTNPPAVADERRLTVRRTIHIEAPIEKVWSAVTEPEYISRWFGQTALDDHGPGATGTVTFTDRTPMPVRVEELEPPTTVSYRWCNEEEDARVPTELDEKHSTVFTFTLQTVDDGTELTVVETGFETTSDPVVNLRAHRSGWESELDKLVALLEDAS